MLTDLLLIAALSASLDGTLDLGSIKGNPYSQSDLRELIERRLEIKSPQEIVTSKVKDEGYYATHKDFHKVVLGLTDEDVTVLENLILERTGIPPALE